MGGALQGKFIGPALRQDQSEPFLDSKTVTAVTCNGQPGQQWDLVQPSTGAVLASPPSSPVWVRHRVTGQLMHVPECARAPLPAGPGPRISVTSANASSQCAGRDRLWQFQRNGTVTVGVDGQCLNTYEGGGGVQTFACGRQGTQSNGQWEVKDGQIIVQVGFHPLGEGLCSLPRTISNSIAHSYSCVLA